MNLKVDQYISKVKKWQEETDKLRKIILACGLTEEFKWGKPCYSFGETNVVIIQGFKEYCALLFFKGMLMSDPDGILIKTGANTRVGRQIRFTEVGEIARMERTLKKYIREAIEIEKSGLKIPTKEKTAQKIPIEFKRQMDERPELKAAFNTLTPGRQRAYLFFFSSAKQPITRESRIEKCIKQILSGKGLNE